MRKKCDSNIDTITEMKPEKKKIGLKKKDNQTTRQENNPCVCAASK